jgi:hypothetical protein
LIGYSLIVALRFPFDGDSAIQCLSSDGQLRINFSTFGHDSENLNFLDGVPARNVLAFDFIAGIARRTFECLSRFSHHPILARN